MSAIGNNSQILRECLSNNDVSKPCSDALKYIVHFFGDITQPLHCSSYERGGNQIEVRCQNRRRNFHSVSSLFDTSLRHSAGTLISLISSKIRSGHSILGQLS